MEFRKATEKDLHTIVRMLADDELGATRECFEDPLPDTYIEAFNDVESQVGNQIIVAVEDEKVIGCMQLIIIPGLARLGMKRAQIEGVQNSPAFFPSALANFAMKYSYTLPNTSCL